MNSTAVADCLGARSNRPGRPSRVWVRCCGIALGFGLMLSCASAQTNRTWTGTVSTDWFNPGNWSPTGVPATNDIVSFTNGTINLSAPVVINGQFNWSGGTLSGDGLTIATNGAMSISGPSTLFLQCSLTNAGTVTWTNNGNVDVQNQAGFYSGLIENLAGALFNIQNNQSLFNNALGPAYFHNAGTLLKSAGTGTTTISLPLLNSGTVTGLQGTVSFGGGGSLAGTFTAAGGAAMAFSGGSFSNSVPVAINGPGAVQFTGGTLLLLADVIANLPLTQGTVSLGPAFQGGTITNLTIAGATLAGTNTVSGTFNWNNGTIAGGPLTIASNGVMNINGTTTLFLDNPLTNAGTVTWTGNGNVDVLNQAGFNFGLIENLAGAQFNIQNNQNLFNNSPGPAYFHNAGTLLKSAGMGNTTISLPIINSGSVIAQAGTLLFTGGGPLAGSFTSAAGAAIAFAGGSFSNSVPVAINGPGAVQFTGGTLLLLADVIANLPLTQGTVSLGPAFQQGGTITNLTIAGATLAGTNTVTGTFNWNNGTIAGGPLTVASNGVMNINGTTTLFLDNPLTNAGTVTWTGNGSVDVLNQAGFYFGLIENLAGAQFNIQNNQNLFNNSPGPAYFHNAGTLQKSAALGTTTISLPVTNSGAITVLQGNLAFTGGLTPIGGTNLFGMSAATSFGTMSISGNATLDGTVGAVWLNGFVPASGNAFPVLSYGSRTGIFTNVSLPAGPMWQTNYGPTSFTLSVASINKLVFTTQPVGGELANIVLPPVVVQIEDPSNNPVAISGVQITLSLNSGSGVLNGTLMQTTDPSGKAAFGDLSLSAIGAKTLRAASGQLTAAVSVSFQIVPLIGEQWSHAGLLLQLNGTNSLGPVTIYASTNLVSWLPIYTNAPTNGPIQFLDTSATNYPARFYKVFEP